MGEVIWSSKAYEMFGDGSRVSDLPTYLPSTSPSSSGDIPAVIPDWKPYESEVITEDDGRTPVVIKGRADYREQLKRRGLECVDSGKPFVSRREAERRKSKKRFF